MSLADQRLAFDAEMAGLGDAESEQIRPRAEFAAEAEKRRQAAAQSRKAFGAWAAVFDFLASGAGVLLGQTFLRGHSLRTLSGSATGGASLEAELALALFAGLLVVLFNRGDRGYVDGGSLLQIRATERALRSAMLALLALLPFAFLLHAPLSLAAWVASFLIAPLLLVLEKQALAATLRKLRRQGHGVERVVVYGSGIAARRVVSALLDSPQLGMRPVAAIDEGASPGTGWMFALGYRGRGAIPVRHGQAERLLESCACDALVIASENAAPKQAAEMASIAEQMGMRVMYLAHSDVQDGQQPEFLFADGLLLVSSADSAPAHYVLAKRALDLILASAFLILLAPLFLAIALWIRIDSPGPALFVQKRVGRRGRNFEIVKFRTMRRDSLKYDVSPANPADARITRAGRFLRRTSLDELPQLFNVLAGHMSLVGPRPEMPFLVERHFRQHQPRLRVLPGITGLWQLSADREFRIHENVHYDLYYIQNRSLFLDAAILIHTLLFAMRGV